MNLPSAMGSVTLRAPFPYFGGKSRASPAVWEAFGNVPNYVEPFAGSLAVLLGRPHSPRIETVNDLDCHIANFWRASKADPEKVAHFADWPVNEPDLHARHAWLVELLRGPFRERMFTEPEYFDAQAAGWLVWGISAWLGSGWCGRSSTKIQLPSVGEPGRGIHAPTLTHRRKPKTNRDTGVHARRDTLLAVFGELRDRLRSVRVVCGDWQRVLGKSTLGIDTPHGMTPCGVLLDPPYANDVRMRDVYATDDDTGDLSKRVREWALESGENPALRIALCGYEGEHEMPSTWRRVEWKSQNAWANAGRERIWFSPHCLGARQGSMFAAGGAR